MATALFIGIKGTVLALDRTTGHIIWRTALKGSEFVNVVLDQGELYATTKGEIFALDAATGQIRWKNELHGLGRGLVTIATSDGGIAAIEEKQRRDQAAAIAATTAAST